MTQVAMVFPGAMGAPIASLLTCNGIRVLSPIGERSRRTQTTALAAGVVATEDLRSAIIGADMIISLVPPGNAVAMAQRCATELRGLTPQPGRRRPLYLEANSVSPGTARQVAAIVEDAGAACVDATMIGPASQVGNKTLMVVSGPEACKVAHLIGHAIELRIVGDEIGQASSLKMLIAFQTKAVAALGMEMLSAAAKVDQEHILRQMMERFYPETADFLDRNLPTYVRHAARRVDELREVEEWLREIGHDAAMVEAARTVIEKMARLHWNSNRTWTSHSIIERMVNRRVLSDCRPRPIRNGVGHRRTTISS